MSAGRRATCAEDVIHGDEPIAALVNGLDEPRHLCFVAERRPQPTNGGVETVLEVDKRPVRPESSAQLLAADHFSGPFEQGRQDAERLLLERDPDTALAQLARSRIHFERAEADDLQRRGGECLHTFPIEWIVS